MLSNIGSVLHLLLQLIWRVIRLVERVEATARSVGTIAVHHRRTKSFRRPNSRRDDESKVS